MLHNIDLIENAISECNENVRILGFPAFASFLLEQNRKMRG